MKTALSVSTACVITNEKLSLNIAIIDVNLLHIHEEVIPDLLNQLTRQMRMDRCVKDPIIVDEKSLVVLDGVHRVASLRKLGIKRVPACLIDYMNRAIRVLSWYRTIIGASNAEQVVSEITKAGCTVEETGKLRRKIIGISPIVAVLQSGRRTFLVESPFEHLQEAYNTIERIEERLKATGLTIKYQTEHDAIEDLKSGRIETVLCTPEISKKEIIDSALSGRIFVSKATRHVIPARPLNVNVPFSLLRDRKSLIEVNNELRKALQSRRLKRLPSGSLIDGRRYEEELYVFEE